MNASVRPACADDIDGICRIENETSASPWSRASIAQDIDNDAGAYVAVLTCEGGGASGASASRAAGYADMWLVAGEAQLNNIAVDERYRGRGYGGMLLSHMMQEAASRGCTVMTLEVRRGNEAAISLYTKAGFVQTGVRPRYYSDNNEDAVLMDRQITD